MATAWAGKCFIKKVPASGVAPSYKLTLPQQIVHKHLAHLVGQEFELASSPRATQQTWPASIAPRRNKERSEYTLKGWKLFAEAHRVRLGDHVSFELVTPTRLVVKVISRDDTGPLSSQSPCRSSRSPSAPSSPSKSPKRPLFCSPDHNEHTMPSQLRMTPEPCLPAQNSVHPESNLPAQVSLALNDDSSSQDLLCSTAPFADWWNAVGSSSDASSNLDADLGLAGQVFAASPGTPQVHGTPGHPPPLRISGAREPAGSQAALFSGTPPTASSNTTFFDQMVDAVHPLGGGSLPAGSCVDKQALVNRSATHDGTTGFNPRSQLDLQLCNLDTTVRDLQVDVKRFETRANQAEQEEARLRGFLGNARTKLETGLQAVAGLERVAGRLANSDLLSSMPHSSDKLIATQQEMCHFIDALKSGIWHILSTDA